MHTTHFHSVGCVIDASHFSALYLDVKIIDFAVSKGFPLSDKDWIIHGNASDAIAWEVEGILACSLRDQVRWIADEAVEWLNDQVRDADYVYRIEDNSLYLDDASLYLDDEQF